MVSKNTEPPVQGPVEAPPVKRSARPSTGRDLSNMSRWDLQAWLLRGPTTYQKVFPCMCLTQHRMIRHFLLGVCIRWDFEKWCHNKGYVLQLEWMGRWCSTYTGRSGSPTSSSPSAIRIDMIQRVFTWVLWGCRHHTCVSPCSLPSGNNVTRAQTDSLKLPPLSNQQSDQKTKNKKVLTKKHSFYNDLNRLK